MKAQMIKLGYEIGQGIGGTGVEVLVPLKHTAVTGQTQESGKTTALERCGSKSTLEIQRLRLANGL